MPNANQINILALMPKTLQILLIFLPFQALWSQTPYPQDYFQNPLDIPIVLSGSFAELRSNHFHAGLDIRTQGRQGLNVRCVQDGRVRRIRVSLSGYGKTIYIEHPNGTTSVYAHLKKFAPKIEEYVKKNQYEKESFTIQLFPELNEFPIKASFFSRFNKHIHFH